MTPRERKNFSAPPFWVTFLVNVAGTLAMIPIFLFWCLRASARRLREFDHAATYWVSAVGTEFEWWIVAAPSRLGDGWVYAAVVLALRHFGHKTQAGHIAGCVLTAWGSSALLKMLVRRKRRRMNPGISKPWLAELKSWSFPSQHAACALAFAVALYDHQTAFAIAATLALGICASRIAIGAHYFGDVLAGIALGVAAGVWG